MKKISQYILILIILIGLFSPLITIQAQSGGASGSWEGEGSTWENVPKDNPDIKGICVITDKNKTSPTTVNITQKDCLNKIDVQKGISVQWSLNLNQNSTYQLLAPIDTMAPVFYPAEPNALGIYLNIIIKIIIGICAVLAIVMIVLGGLQYMTSELISSKEAGKERIRGALLGLLIALGAYALLFTINPDLLNTDLKSLTAENITVTFTESPETIVSGDKAKAICGKKTTVNGQTVTSCDDSAIVPYTLFGVKVIGGVNKVIVKDLDALNKAWNASADTKLKSYKMTIGGYEPRSATNNATSPSGHSFGISLDINPGQNPYSESITPCTTNMPKRLVELFTKYNGFGWGGYWKTKKDTMHYSKFIGEVGFTSGTCAGLK